MKIKKMSQRPFKLPEGKTAVIKTKQRAPNKVMTEKFLEQGIKLTITKKKKDNLSKVITEEFFEHDLENDTDNNAYDGDEIDKNTDDEDAEFNSSSESNLEPEESKRFRSLMKLQDYDFYEADDKEDNSSVNSDDMYTSNENLKVANADSDFQLEAESHPNITMKLLKTWQQEIQRDTSIITIKYAVEAFHAALNSMAISSVATTQYKVGGNARNRLVIYGLFNGVMELCITYLPDAFRRLLKLDAESREAHKSKNVEKIQKVLKLYLSDLINLLHKVALSNGAVLIVLLKHLHQMLPYIQPFSSLTKSLLEILLKLWSTADETVRVIAFLNILHFATSKEFVLEELLETMYEKYVQNTKLVSLDTLPGINFMRRSLVEIYLLDHNTSYKHAFLHIRQLAINLRNTITLKNKENFQAVYNWQYVNSLRLWTELMNKTKDKSVLRSLLYPLVQIIIRTIKINPSALYYPLRFHCLEMLITISKETGTFIPILPFLLEILDSYDFNKRHKTVSTKPVSLICILRVSKSQLVENGFKDSIIEIIYQLVLEHAACESHRIYFPDLYLSCIIQLKEFLEKCHVAAYCKKMKQLLTVIEENKRYIETERTKATVDLKNMAEIVNWENRIKTDGTAIAKYYVSCIKLCEFQKSKFLTKNTENSNVFIEKI
ncbi:nucleolar complex protein 2 homolog [Monomorium pharaonis]|uniref:nucleolar complex protein 2 homolog n=1 Tax=Monomorium pharaonis TaxID=307658 RepID=UPI00102E18C5|nr:nucleolar complex protein 2 homolog [Monomorium pharaonis]